MTKTYLDLTERECGQIASYAVDDEKTVWIVSPMKEYKCMCAISVNRSPMYSVKINSNYDVVATVRNPKGEWLILDVLRQADIFKYLMSLGCL